jgi:cell division protein FtsA
MILNDESFMIPGIGGRKPTEITKSMLARIIQPRMEEILEFALAEIQRSGYLRHLSAGVVLTGGGSLLRGSSELAQEVLGMPVKIGIPSGFSGGALAPEVESPIYSTGVGLVLRSLDIGRQRREVAGVEVGESPDGVDEGEQEGFLSRMKKFFEEL